LVDSKIESTINDWLQDEQQTITKIPQEQADFFFRIDKAMGTNLSINIAKIKNRDMIQVLMGIAINAETKKKLSKKENNKASSFLIELQTNFLMKGVQFAWVPSFKEMTQIQIQDNLYVSEITKTHLFNSMKLVKDAGALALLVINQHVKIVPTETTSTNVQPGVQ